MHVMPAVRRLLVIAATVLTMSLTGRAVAQTAPVFVATRDLFIDPVTADLGQGGYLLVSRTGEFLVVDNKEDIIKVFNATGPVGTIGRKGEGPGEFRNLTVIGWIGDSVWALDPNLKRVSIFGPNHKFVRSFPMPPAIAKDKASHDSVDVVTESYAQALLSDGTLRVIASYRQTKKPSWAAGVDSGSTLYVRVTPDGVLKGRIAVFAPSKCSVSFAIGAGGIGNGQIPFCAERKSSDWSGSGPLATAAIEPTGNAYRVTLIGETGTNLFTRVVPFAPIPVSKAAQDSSADARAKNLAKQGRAGAAYLAAMPKITPATIWPPVKRVVVGRDRSVWVEEAATTPGHRWRILDAKGSVVGTVTLPADITLYVADVSNIWGYLTDSDGLQGIVRFRLERSKG